MRCLAPLLALLLAVCSLSPAFAEPPPYDAPDPPLAAQPNPDEFDYNFGDGRGQRSIAHLNPAHRELLATGIDRWQYQTAPGCSGRDTGLQALVRQSMEYMEAELLAQRVARIDFREEPGGWLITGNCGAAWNALAPGAVGCLCRGFPYDVRIDIDAPTLLSWAFPVSKLAVIIHELKHKILTWNEQYNRRLFIAVPGWRDFMNTGPDSRHLYEYTELERTKRSLWPEPFQDICGGSKNLPCVGNGRDAGGAYVWFCEPFDDLKVTRISVLYEINGRIEWAGIHLDPDNLDGNRCRGVRVQERTPDGQRIRTLLKRENGASWEFATNEVYAN